jgi:hypothetical protein
MSDLFVRFGEVTIVLKYWLGEGLPLQADSSFFQPIV